MDELEIAVCDNCGHINSSVRLPLGCLNCRERKGKVYSIKAKFVREVKDRYDD